MNDSKVPKVALGPPRLFRQYEVGGRDAYSVGTQIMEVLGIHVIYE